MAEQVWRQPHDAVCNGGHTTSDGRLVLYNSLIDRKVPFVPIAGPHSKNITWYTCGPTVYDSTHMGHARNYLAFDIVRRVLEDYFGYNVMFIMNVTDVDDKIILRARRNHLLVEYLRERGADINLLLADATAALSTAEAKQRAKTEKAFLEAEAAEAEAAAEGSATAAKRRDGFLEATASENLLLTKTQGDVAKLQQLVSSSASEKQLPRQEDVLAVASDALAADLDAQHGVSVTDPAIFRGHAARFEAAFLEDMATLGVRPPTVFTRVSEYIPEIVEYIEKIVTNGLAYESSGSVYFDTQAFIAAGHTYGKLNPWAVGSALAAEPNESGAEKRHPCDFALWKAAKPGEPTWGSPWGQGRPGWHIECSAMASAIAGSQLDIHTGGEDLRFPHHDNELAQAEAYFHCEGCCQWVNYFLHSGHLGIEGLKMSKSLKNFITVREALETFTPRQLRLMMILTSWDRRMAYGEQVREEMRARECQLRNFFANVDVVLRRANGGVAAPGPQKWSSDEKTLSSALDTAAAAVHARFLDSVDTRGAMDALSDLIKATNTYLAARQDASGPPAQAFLLRQVAGYVTRILSVLGLTPAAADNVCMGSSDGVGNGTAGDDARVAAVLDIFCEFRDEVRKLARCGAAHKDVLAACDTVRDDAMVDLGVRLEDQADGGSVWKNDDPVVLRAEREEKAAAAKAAAARKVKSKLDGLKRDLDKFEKLAALPSVQEALAEKYSRFNDVSGEPTHDASGSALEGKALDKARKDLEKAKKVRSPLEKRIADDGPEFWDRMKADIAVLEAQLSALKGSAPSG